MATTMTRVKIAEIFDNYLSEHSKDMTPDERDAFNEIAVDVHADATIEVEELGTEPVGKE